MEFILEVVSELSADRRQGDHLHETRGMRRLGDRDLGEAEALQGSRSLAAPPDRLTAKVGLGESDGAIERLEQKRSLLLAECDRSADHSLPRHHPFAPRSARNLFEKD
jgi:hypothetical protein